MKTIDKEKFGAFIGKKRREKNLTQKDLAEKLFISPQAVSKWERGLSYPDISLLIPLADILEVRLSDLLQGEESRLESEANVEDLIKNVVTMTAENPEEERKMKKKNTLIFTIVGIFALIEYYFFYKYVDIAKEDLILPLILGLVFGSQAWIFLKEKLPTYYDENKISFVSNGFFRMNMAGINFNNSNWKPLLAYLRYWTLGFLIFSPFILLALNRILGFGGEKFFGLIILVSIFLPTYYIGKKYQ